MSEVATKGDILEFTLSYADMNPCIDRYIVVSVHEGFLIDVDAAGQHDKIPMKTVEKAALLKKGTSAWEIALAKFKEEFTDYQICILREIQQTLQILADLNTQE